MSLPFQNGFIWCFRSLKEMWYLDSLFCFYHNEHIANSNEINVLLIEYVRGDGNKINYWDITAHIYFRYLKHQFNPIRKGKNSNEMGHAVAYWLRHYATNRKVAGSIPDKVISFKIYLILPAALGPGDYSASNRNRYQRHKNNVSGEQSAAGL
jgi:hypothetical protein